jgi:hypothetical protein
VGAGLAALFRGGITAFVNWDTLLGLRDVTVHNVTAGVRFEF